jgi:lysozyme
MEIMAAAVDLALPLIEKAEGFRDRPYLCPAGHWTIGFGMTRYPAGGTVSPSDPPITRGEATEMLRTLAERLWENIAPQLQRPAAPNQGAAMLSLAYNIGVGAFLASTLLKKFNAGDTAGAADEFLRWDKARVGGKIVALPGLTARRKAERALFLGETDAQIA